MGYIRNDIEAELQMMRCAYMGLKERNPNHELLNLISLDSDERGFNNMKSLWDKYPEKTHPTGIHVYAAYTLELKVAMGRNPLLPNFFD